MSTHRDPKTEELRRRGTLNPHPERVQERLFGANEFFDPRDLLQVKYEMLRKRLVEGESATRAASLFGFSRPSFYQALETFEREGLSGLLPRRRGPREAHKLSGPVVAFILEALRTDESLRTADLVEMAGDEFGIHVHPRSLERALARHEKKGL